MISRMCFSPGMSFSFFLAGAGLAVYSYVNEELRGTYAYIIFGFYSLMELLQTIQYHYVNKCGGINEFLTNVAYILVIVQPLLWNSIFYFQSKKIRENSKEDEAQAEYEEGVFKLAIVLCLVWIAWSLYGRFSYKADRNAHKNMCGFYNHEKTCTYRNSKKSHLYWRWTSRHITDMTANYFMYYCLWIFPALIVKRTRFVGSLIALSAIVGWLFTVKLGMNIMEYPSIWCYISIPLLIIGYGYVGYCKFYSRET